MGKLTAKKRLFAHEYVVDMIGAAAAERATYAKSRARQTAHELLQEPEVKALIEELMAKRINQVEANAEMVLRDLLEYRQADLRHLYEENGAMKPIHEWPEFFTRMGVISLKTREEFETNDGKRELIGYVKEVKWEGKTKILEMIGKHIDVNAFRDNKVHDVAEPLKDLYEQIFGHSLRPPDNAEPAGLGKKAAPGLARKAEAAFKAIRPKED